MYSAQQYLFGHLSDKYPGQFSRIAVSVGGINKESKGYSFPEDQDREDSQRTRSFLFLTLAAIVARRLGTNEVITIAENGQMAIHLPLTAARIGAFSTRTAHPEVLQCMEQLLTSLLSHTIAIRNPFLYMTKAEVISPLIKHHSSVIASAVSCWMASRLGGSANHCGVCVPCLVRRIAIEYNGIKLDEYKRDLLSEDVALLDEGNDGKRNLVELAEFIKKFDGSQAAIQSYYPELCSDECYDSGLVIEMYRRFAHEAKVVFDRYPNVKGLVA